MPAGGGGGGGVKLIFINISTGSGEIYDTISKGNEQQSVGIIFHDGSSFPK